MKNKILFSALVSTALVGCMDDSITQNTTNGVNGDSRISFVQKVGNMTKGTQKAEAANHYEFGVFAALGGIYDPDAPTSAIMNNYLVAYKNDSHYTVAGGGDTWQTPSGSNETLTVPENGYSSWFYQGLTSTDSKAELTQILKYWDFSTDNTDFIAYMPYEKQAGVDPASGEVTYEYVTSPSTANLTYYGLSSFYTAPATGKQVATAVEGKTTTAHVIAEANKANDENIINANEALYAHTNVPKANYGLDVPLEFKHVNAKIKVAIYENIPGYKVHILDLVPEDLSGKGGPAATSPGVQFTPATHEDATAYAQPTKASTLQGKYYASANVQVSGVNNPATATVSIPDQTTALVNTNTFFAAPVGAAASPAIPNHSETVIGEDQGNATESATVHYVLPNHNGTEYIIGNSAASSAVEATGYTFHVSYEIIPEDGLASTKVYDARVWVAPDYCRWQAGKAYTYIFKITKNSNGTTDPGKVDPADPSTPWIDPDDPRIPDDPALIPIVFDGVMVCDYDDAGDVEGNDHVITDITTDPNWGKQYAGEGSKTYTLSYGRYSEAFVTSIKSAYDVYDYSKITTLASGTWVYDATNKVFNHKNTTSAVDATFMATVDMAENLGTAGTVTWYYTRDGGEEQNTTTEGTIETTDVITKVVTAYPSAAKTYTATSYIWNDVENSGHYTANKLTSTKTDSYTSCTSTVTPPASTTKENFNSASYTPVVNWGSVSEGTWSDVTGPAAAAEYHGSAHVIVIKK